MHVVAPVMGTEQQSSLVFKQEYVVPEGEPWIVLAGGLERGRSMTGARVVPALDQLALLPTRLNAGERATVDALAQLGSDWHVFVQPRLAMAQPDFVVVHPRKGVWILEVKDWSPKLYRPVGPPGGRLIEVFHGDRWVRKPSPKEQVNAYEETFGERFFVDYADTWVPDKGLRVLLVLPRFSRDEASKLLGAFPLVVGDDLADLAKELTASPDAALEPGGVEELLRWMDEPENVGDQRLPLVLSAQAREVASNPREVRFRRVRGPAGSGKSLALASRAIELASRRKEVLVVTFNITLVHYLHDLCSRGARHKKVFHWKNAVSFTHFHGMLKQLVRQRGEKPNGGEWDSATIRMLSNAYSEPGHNLPVFDAILVDEGQDFEGEWWAFLKEHMLRPGGEMLLVADKTQNLYHRSNWTESGTAGGGFSGPWFELIGTYRMPVDLIPIAREFAERYLPEQGRDLPTIERDHPVLGDAHEPTIRRWSNVADVDVVEAAADEVMRLTSDVDRLSPSDVVLLAGHNVGVAIMTELRARGNDVLSMFTPNDGYERRQLKWAFWAGTPGIKGCTVHSFKGWESRAIVHVPSKMGELALYIAMTRVKAAPSRPSCISVINAVDSLRGFKERFDREVFASEVPALAGQATLDV